MFLIVKMSRDAYINPGNFSFNLNKEERAIVKKIVLEAFPY